MQQLTTIILAHQIACEFGLEITLGLWKYKSNMVEVQMNVKDTSSVKVYKIPQ